MKNFDIFVQIISEATGRSIEDVKLMTDVILKLAGSEGRIYQEIPDAEAQELLAKLRNELPGIRAWLLKGGLMMEAEIARAEDKAQ